MLKTAFSSTITLFAMLSAQAAIIDVPADQPTIQAGVDAASHGDTVRVAVGTYNLSNPVEIIGKQIRLEGAGSAATVLNGGNSNTLLVIRNVGGSGVTVAKHTN